MEFVAVGGWYGNRRVGDRRHTLVHSRARTREGKVFATTGDPSGTGQYVQRSAVDADRPREDLHRDA